MDIVLHVVHVMTALALIVLVLLQQGKGASAGASFGAGASQTVFGGRGSGNFLTRTTAILATVFFITSLALAWQARQGMVGDDSFLPELETVDEVPAPEEEQAPAEPAEIPAAPAQGGDEGAAIPGADEAPAPAEGGGEQQ